MEDKVKLKLRSNQAPMIDVPPTQPVDHLGWALSKLERIQKRAFRGNDAPTLSDVTDAIDSIRTHITKNKR
jgi:hypothetical protein